MSEVENLRGDLTDLRAHSLRLCAAIDDLFDELCRDDRCPRVALGTVRRYAANLAAEARKAEQ